MVLPADSAVATVTRVPEHSKIPRRHVATGIDRLLADDALVEQLRMQRIGLLTHDACCTADRTPTRLAVARALGTSGGRGLVRLFTPEHGMAASAPAGVAVADGRDPATDVPMASLYGPRFVPPAAMLDDLDVVIVDLRDVGVRCFTHAATAARLLAVAATRPQSPEIFVCDRPNPLGANTAGPSLDPALRSLVAWFDVPFVHGRTLGGLLRLAAAEHGFDRLHVVEHDSTPTAGEPDWLAPSPALAHPQAVAFYPGLVLVEGTNLCEGRGTALPFRSVAAPWLDTQALAADIAGWQVPVVAETTSLMPTTGRYAGAGLPALAFSLASVARFDALAFGVRLLCTIAARHREFAWLPRDAAALAAPGSEAGYVIDWLMGSGSLRTAVARGDGPESILSRWLSP